MPSYILAKTPSYKYSFLSSWVQTNNDFQVSSGNCYNTPLYYATPDVHEPWVPDKDMFGCIEDDPPLCGLMNKKKNYHKLETCLKIHSTQIRLSQPQFIDMSPVDHRSYAST